MLISLDFCGACILLTNIFIARMTETQYNKHVNYTLFFILNTALISQISYLEQRQHIHMHWFIILWTKPLGMQASIIRCLSQARINWEGYGRKGIWHKNGGDDEGGGTDSPDGVASRWTVRASASIIFPCYIKSRRWQSVMEEVDKGCSEPFVSVGTVTRTAGILIHSWLKALAVNLIRPSGRLWLYAGLIGSANPRCLKAELVVCANPSPSSWV